MQLTLACYRTHVTISLAGRRIDAPGAEPPRFPLQAVPLVSARLEALFQRLRPVAFVCSAACGADLVALDAAGGLGIRRRVVLPFSVEEFRERSVTDRPGDWGPTYDRIVASVSRAGDLVVLGLSPEDNGAYEEANRVILRETLALPEPHSAVIVWEGSSRGASDATAHFQAEAGRLGFQLHEILTTG